MNEERTHTLPERLLLALAALIAFASLGMLCLAIIRVCTPYEADITTFDSELSALGDLSSGIAGSLLSLVGSVLLYVTLRLQQRTWSAQQRALRVDLLHRNYTQRLTELQEYKRSLESLTFEINDGRTLRGFAAFLGVIEDWQLRSIAPEAQNPVAHVQIPDLLNRNNLFDIVERLSDLRERASEEGQMTIRDQVFILRLIENERLSIQRAWLELEFVLNALRGSLANSIANEQFILPQVIPNLRLLLQAIQEIQNRIPPPTA